MESTTLHPYNQPPLIGWPSCQLVPIELAHTMSNANVPSPDDSTVEWPFLESTDESDCIGRFGRYLAKVVLGRGSSAIVFRARDTQIPREVALKALKPTLLTSAKAEDYRARFLQDAALMASVIHEHVMPVYDLGSVRSLEEELPYYTMPFYPGETLEDRLNLQQEDFSTDEVLRVAHEICLGIAAIHAEGIIHRDIKPSNILLCAPRAHVRILDFGLARELESPALTSPGSIVGTPHYLAPEQANGAPCMQSDQFSLGCILYRLITRQLPFNGERMAVLTAIVSEKPVPPEPLIERCPQALADLVLRLLSKTPTDRFSTAQEAAIAIQHMREASQQTKQLVLPTDAMMQLGRPSDFGLSESDCHEISEMVSSFGLHLAAKMGTEHSRIFLGLAQKYRCYSELRKATERLISHSETLSSERFVEPLPLDRASERVRRFLYAFANRVQDLPAGPLENGPWGDSVRVISKLNELLHKALQQVESTEALETVLHHTRSELLKQAIFLHQTELAIQKQLENMAECVVLIRQAESD